VLKRSVDVSLAGFLLIASLPLLAAAAIIIKLNSQGPVFFRQVRMGRKFRRFQILKLRTMNTCNFGPTYTHALDPRITAVGRWLRWLKLDELPQLWNVLRGDMSLVGPRPVVPELTFEFLEAYAPLLEVRPGLTDPATVKYCREDEFLALVGDKFRFYKTVLIPDKLRISAAYLEHANAWSDLGVLARTALALVPPSWAFPFERVWASAALNAGKRLFAHRAQTSKVQRIAESVDCAGLLS
jgi:lipopolysaccharide/colanic/teichoic acid biosynthesis glycosyltransferase